MVNGLIKPSNPVQLDNTNSYASKILWSVNPGVQFKEIVTGAIGSIVGTVTWPNSTGNGPSANVATAGNHGVKWPSSNASLVSSLGANWSVIAVVNLAATGATNGKIMSFPASEGSWVDPFDDFNLQLLTQLGVAGGIANEWANGTTAGTQNFPSANPGGTATAGFHVFITSWNGTTMSTFMDGVSIGTYVSVGGSAAATPTWAQATGYIFMAGAAQTGESVAGDIYMVSVINQALTTNDVNSLSANPYQFWQTQVLMGGACL